MAQQLIQTCVAEASCKPLEGDFSQFYSATQQEYDNWQNGGTINVSATVYDAFATEDPCSFTDSAEVKFCRPFNNTVGVSMRGASCPSYDFGQAIDLSFAIFSTRDYGYRVFFSGAGYCGTSHPYCYSCAPSIAPYSEPDPYWNFGSPSSTVFGRTFYGYIICPNDNYLVVNSFTFNPAS